MKVIKLFVLSIATTAILSFSPNSKKIIVIDAGHGGNDMGATRDGITEKEIVLGVASQIKILSSHLDEYEIILTRDSDNYSTLGERASLINKLNPEMVLSLHLNSAPNNKSDKKGIEIYTQNTDASKKLADKISKKLGASKISEENLYILRESKSPAVLVELGFISNKEDRDYLKTQVGQKEIAKKLVEVITEK